LSQQAAEPPIEPNRHRHEQWTQTPPSTNKVLRLAAPAIVEQLLYGVIGLTDVVIAGHLPGSADFISAATAAVGMITYLQWFVALIGGAVGGGATAIVARAIGARRIRMANRVAGTAVTAALVAGIISSALMFVFAHQVVAACQLSSIAADLAVQFLRIMMITSSLQIAGQIGMACIRGAGDTVRPMLIMLLLTAFNCLTSATFAYGWFGMPAWGLAGDAFGTMLAYLVGGSLAMAALFSKHGRIRLELRHMRIIPHVLVRILKIGLPSGLEQMLLWLGQIIIVIFVINSRNDLNGHIMAAHISALRLESISFLPGLGFAIAASALVGQYLGAGKADEAKHAAHIANRLAIITMTLLAVPMVFFPGFMLELIVKSPPVIQAGWWPMVLAGLAQPGFAIAIVLAGALRGAGETIPPMISTVTGMLVVRVLVVVVCLAWLRHEHINGANLTAVWIAIFIDLNYRGVYNYLAFERGQWQKRKV
jgi:multidrug resistance protein, MATE family